MDVMEGLADEALRQAETERLAELREHPKQVEIKYLIDGREATQDELEDMALIQAEQEAAQQEALDRLLHTHRRAIGWLNLVGQLKARDRKVLTT